MSPRNLLLSLTLFVFATTGLRAQGQVTGELQKWHRIQILFNGPQTSESASQNPFLNYRLNVLFTAPDGREFTVPGFFAADGNAAETSASSGNKWAVRFSPDQVGTWTYTASFRTGNQVAISLDPNAGSATGFDGASGSFQIGLSTKSAPDNRSKGRLEYVGERYLRFRENGTYFLKAGADSPENLLAYADFDNTVASKTWSPHLGDWQQGDADWKNGKGKALIGAVNYLASKGMNAFSFLTMSVIGDGKDVWPWVSTTHSGLDEPGGQDAANRLRYDISKLEQWEILFQHADSKGMFLHFKTQEEENDRLLDGGELGVQRKLYYRELVARFGHHLALNWNLGEENDLYNELGDTNNTRVKAYASYIKSLDPYDHHIVIHSYPNSQDDLYGPLLGDSDLTGPSLQIQINNIHRDVKRWVNDSKASGKQWVVTNDEQGDHTTGVAADASYSGDKGSRGDNRAEVRNKTLWGTLMAGGAGVEYYFGYQTGVTDLTAEDWRSRKTKWEDAKRALDFFNDHLPFWAMESRDHLISKSGSYCFAKTGEVYAVYIPSSGTESLNLSGVSGTYSVRWFNPRSGGSLKQGSVATISGGGVRNLGTAPSDTGADWVALVEKTSDSGGDGGGTGNCQADFEEQGGRVVIEAERLDLAQGWNTGNSFSGATGSGYIVWKGGNSFGSPGNGTISVSIEIHTPGTYRFEWRNRVGHGTNSTEANDSWVRFPDADDFYGEKNGNRVYPKGSGKSPNPAGASADGWFKVYLSGTTDWTWSTNTSDHNAHQVYAEFDSPGVYTLQISGRSNDHLIDRITLALAGQNATDLSLGETLCEGGSETVAVTGVTVVPDAATLLIGETLQFGATVLPADATDKSVSWSSSDPSVATVSGNGTVQALSEGQVEITATTSDGNFTHYALLTVEAADPPGDDPGDGGSGEDPGNDGGSGEDPGNDGGSGEDPGNDGGSGEDPNGDGNGEEPGDGAPQAAIQAVDVRQTEGRPMRFDFSLSQPASERIVLELAFVDITTGESDYVAPQTELVFEAGSQQASLEVQTISDLKTEEDESFQITVVRVISGQVALPDVLATGTILDDDRDMKVSPNPATSYSMVQMSNVQEGTYELEIYAASGHLMQRETVTADGSGIASVTLGGMAKGLYIVKLTGIDYSYTAKMLVK